MLGPRSGFNLVIVWVNVILMTVLGSGAAALNAPSRIAPMARSFSGDLPLQVWIPMVNNNLLLPPATISRYLNTTDFATLRSLGCSRGSAAQRGQDLLMILDFGPPAYNSDTGEYGTSLILGHTFRSIAEISTAVHAFALGFHDCAPADVHLTLSVGTNNKQADVTREHGAAWAQMVNELNIWLAAPPTYPITAWGGFDAEPGFGAPADARAWVDGYVSVAALPSKYLDFGSCDGCPYQAAPSSRPNNNWSLDDVWYIAAGTPFSVLFPEIYRTDGVNADQWYRMSVYAYTNHGKRLDFAGVLTEWNACQEVGGCGIRDNRPADGYTQLHNFINGDPRTAQSIRWSSDISWQK